MFDKMKELMEIQKKAQEMKRQLENTVFEAMSPDGLVKVTMSGSQDVKGVSIQGDLAQLDKAALEKAAREAYNKAVARSREIASQKMKEIAGINLPRELT